MHSHDRPKHARRRTSIRFTLFLLAALLGGGAELAGKPLLQRGGIKPPGERFGLNLDLGVAHLSDTSAKCLAFGVTGRLRLARRGGVAFDLALPVTYMPGSTSGGWQAPDCGGEGCDEFSNAIPWSDLSPAEYYEIYINCAALGLQCPYIDTFVRWEAIETGARLAIAPALRVTLGADCCSRLVLDVGAGVWHQSAAETEVRDFGVALPALGMVDGLPFGTLRTEASTRPLISWGLAWEWRLAAGHSLRLGARGLTTLAGESTLVTPDGHRIIQEEPTRTHLLISFGLGWSW